jgi:hypothetical protein
VGVVAGEASRAALDLDHLRAAALGAALFDTTQHTHGTQSVPWLPVSRWKTEGRRQLLRQPLPRIES